MIMIVSNDVIICNNNNSLHHISPLLECTNKSHVDSLVSYEFEMNVEVEVVVRF